MADARTPLERALTLAAVSGLRATMGPALLDSSRRGGGRRSGWVLGALGEMAVDKLGLFTRRYRPMLMVPHALAGAYAARESLRRDGVEDASGPIMGAVVAAGVAGVAPIARMALNKGLGVNDAVLSMAEDYLALKFGGEAVGLSMEQLGDAAKDALGDLRDKVAPDLEMPAIPGMAPSPPLAGRV
ncbi:hypothetical protein [Planctomyces sp. SH-PL62]|uniref:hypothetical protein n=1 Tax=Planctomyces sp. SH-PL62 TaxID=1636152 RepID=UPI00078B92F9|nr:hypothetical protein [Planctomyces sp. SH-PL62]AMV40874.1 hypothetical protein VT85_25800 [Planctomyces sp. SH-PL62]